MKITANLIDIHQRKIVHSEISIENGRIKSIKPTTGKSAQYILPGFIDAHVHIESSMLVPSEFARLAVVHGTVATISDPHEIANVLGIKGVEYMLENGDQVPLKFHFGAPSCVPATTFETAGAIIDAKDIRTLLSNPAIPYLAEMMNYPGVLFDDPIVLEKIAIAKELGKPIDGHAPGLRGEAAKKYIDAGISTDHECFTYEEGLEKLQYGMKILIREGSAAKNFEALIDLLPLFPDKIMFCSDDKHPDDLVVGHINQLVARALKKGCDLFDVLRAACLHPIEHYKLDVGCLRVGDPADFILTKDIKHFTIDQTYINGQLVADQGKATFTTSTSAIINNFSTTRKKISDFKINAVTDSVRVIKAIDGEIVTESFTTSIPIKAGIAQTNSAADILKISVVNRYQDSPVANAFIHGFGLTQGAIASCVGHDSHNIIAVGVDDESICTAVNLIIQNKGGIAAVYDTDTFVLPLPVAGIMSNKDGHEVAQQYAQIDTIVKHKMACTLTAPYMTLSFMALLVIPQLKLSDKGLFDGKKFQFVELFTEE